MSNKEVTIVKLDYPDNVRTRMGMYGCDGTNADILYRELVDNSIDITLKFRKPINVKSVINQQDWNMLIDDGIGLPLYLDEDFPGLDQPVLIDMMRRINVGSNFNKTEYSLGMNGVGSKLTQAISDDFIIITNAAKKEIGTLPKWIQEEVKSGKTLFAYHSQKGVMVSNEMIKLSDVPTWLESKGVPHTELIDNLVAKVNEELGVLWAFKPDANLLDTPKVSYHGYPFKLIKGLFPFDPDFKDTQVNFELNGQEIDALDFKAIFPDTHFIEDKIFTVTSSTPTSMALPIKFTAQFAYSQDDTYSMADGSVNLLKTPQGKHIALFKTAMNIAMSKYSSSITKNDAQLGLRCFVLNFAVEPLFNSQDKTKLSRYEDKGWDENAIVRDLSNNLLKLMKANKEYFDLIVARIVEYKKSMNRLSNMELLKSSIVLGHDSDKKRIKSGAMAKVYECSSTDPSKRELYITEGLSASSNLIAARNKVTQSILPLRGKLANTSGFDEQRLVDNAEVLAIINTIGCGIGAITDITQSRYSKIIIATDADDDGLHIANLITGLFYNHAPEVIKAGMLYKLESPFYKVEKGGKCEYYYHDELDKFDLNSGHVTKLKGLGSSTLEETRRFMTDVKNRRLVQITWDEYDTAQVVEAARLLTSSAARKQLMVDRGVFGEGL